MGGLGGLLSFPGLTIDRHANGLFDQDWYRWQMGSGSAFHAVLTGIQAGGGDIHIRVFRRNGNNTLSEIGSSIQTGGFPSQGVTVAVSPGQEVYVWVFGFNYATGTYNLSVNLT